MSVQIVLLTHERELDRASNTGQLALQAFPELCRRVIWSRTRPEAALLAMLESRQASLLFPAESEACAVPASASRLAAGRNPGADEPATQAAEACEADTIVILDATWQEARKMLRQSPYLRTAARISLAQPQASRFTQRRNQIPGGLCTLECIIALFDAANLKAEAAGLSADFARWELAARG
ncbi:DTW domain-containing protein [Shewanella sp. AS16]|uniref:DTW domain-containing protein n=1 Tax=Shewanella sp. AS16 TaxID=2907625 RepID=UPI002278D393|nr:tRNA-uridine aminocarboxypropyltransferase [Shewanella sp. AS16]